MSSTPYLLLINVESIINSISLLTDLKLIQSSNANLNIPSLAHLTNFFLIVSWWVLAILSLIITCSYDLNLVNVYHLLISLSISKILLR